MTSELPPTRHQPGEQHHWSEPLNDTVRGLDRGFVISTWGLAAVIDLLLTAAIVGAAALVSDAYTSDATTVVNLVQIALAASTLVAFFGVAVFRLQRFAGDRWANAMGIAVLHIVVTGIVFYGLAAIPGIWPDGSELTEAGTRFGLAFIAHGAAVFEATLSLALAAAMVPFIGRAGSGTQHEVADEREQL